MTSSLIQCRHYGNIYEFENCIKTQDTTFVQKLNLLNFLNSRKLEFFSKRTKKVIHDDVIFNMMISSPKFCKLKIGGGFY